MDADPMTGRCNSWSDDRFLTVGATREQFIEFLQARYDRAKAEANTEVDELGADIDTLNCCDPFAANQSKNLN